MLDGAQPLSHSAAAAAVPIRKISFHLGTAFVFIANFMVLEKQHYAHLPSNPKCYFFNI